MYALYHSKRIGAGTYNDPYCPKIYLYLPVEASDKNYWNWVHPFKAIQHVLVMAPDSLLAQIDADPEIKRLSPKAETLSELKVWLDTSHSSIPNEVKRLIETEANCSLSWLDGTTTPRQVLRYLLKTYNLAGAIGKLKDVIANQFYDFPLDTRVNQMPLQVRNKISNWMINRGLDVGWITGTITVRQVLHYIIQNINWDADGIGPLRF